MRLSLRVAGKGGGVGNRIVWKVNGVTQGNTTPHALASLDGPLASAGGGEEILADTSKLMQLGAAANATVMRG
jgi:hypothetical protein